MHSVFHLKYSQPELPLPETLDDLPHCLSEWAGALDMEELTNKNAYPRDNNIESFPSGGHECVKSARASAISLPTANLLAKHIQKWHDNWVN